ncbi:actin-like isoform X1 [Stegostoma tigrinum]|uniref:actin-like isoform X1 n=1 Tax=Stegostoma tigrinum TaxID=3053191 RepID=UPI00286FB29B|nr:actin-like isoform X1 [Stegostoma tigrinum]
MGCASSVKTTAAASPHGDPRPEPPTRNTLTDADCSDPADLNQPPKEHSSLVSGCERADQETGEIMCQSRSYVNQRTADPKDSNSSITVESNNRSNERNLGEQLCVSKDNLDLVPEDQGQTISKVNVSVQDDVNDPTQPEATETQHVNFHNLMLHCERDLLMRHDDCSVFGVTNSSSSLPSDLYPPVVIDNGSGLIKAGLSENHSPTHVFPSVVGRPKNTTLNVFGLSERCTYVGEEAQRKRTILHLVYPIQHGLITNWAEMEVLWRHAFENELRVDIQEHPIVMTEPPNNSQQNREKTTEILFEAFQVPSLFLGVQAVLALHSTGKVTGTVIDSGSTVTHVVPIIEGDALENITQHVHLGGEDLTEYMMRSLAENNSWSFTSQAGLDIIRNIKEKFCYVALNFEAELKNFKNNPEEIKEEYALPDGQNMIITSQKFICPEVIYKPFLIGKDIQNLPTLTHSVIERCSEEIRNDLYANIVLAGGNSMFKNLEERLQHEMSNLVNTGIKVRVHAPPNRNYLSWKGAAILSDLSNFHQMCVSRQDFEEFGTTVLYRKLS